MRRGLPGMPLLEKDVTFAYLNCADPYHEIARRLFYKRKNEELAVEISSVSLTRARVQE
jgi:hypothetical protein